MAEFSAFTDSKYEPFVFEGDEKRHALLIHGFPGTPDEIRILGAVLNKIGYTAHGILLPGFGKNIDQLEKMTKERWFDFVYNKALEIQHKSDAFIIIGYSFGASITINVLADHPDIRPDKILLFAPFWNIFAQYNLFIRFFGPIVWPIGRLFSPEMAVYENIDFDNPDERKSLEDTFDDVDLDDPKVQEFIRNITIPFEIIDELYKVGRSSKKKIGQLDIPICVIQGSNDAVVPVRETRKLISPVTQLEYHEISNKGHDFVSHQENQEIFLGYITKFLSD